jgi:hypothetical protein
VGFLVDKVAMAQVFSKYVSFPRQLSFRQPLHIHCSSYHRRYKVSTLKATLNNQPNNYNSDKLGTNINALYCATYPWTCDQ